MHPTVGSKSNFHHPASLVSSTWDRDSLGGPGQKIWHRAGGQRDISVELTRCATVKSRHRAGMLNPGSAGREMEKRPSFISDRLTWVDRKTAFLMGHAFLNQVMNSRAALILVCELKGWF